MDRVAPTFVIESLGHPVPDSVRRMTTQWFGTKTDSIPVFLGTMTPTQAVRSGRRVIECDNQEDRTKIAIMADKPVVVRLGYQNYRVRDDAHLTIGIPVPHPLAGPGLVAFYSDLERAFTDASG